MLCCYITCDVGLRDGTLGGVWIVAAILMRYCDGVVLFVWLSLVMSSLLTPEASTHTQLDVTTCKLTMNLCSFMIIAIWAYSEKLVHVVDSYLAFDWTVTACHWVTVVGISGLYLSLLYIHYLRRGDIVHYLDIRFINRKIRRLWLKILTHVSVKL